MPGSSRRDPSPTPPPAEEDELDVAAVDESTPFLSPANDPPASPSSFPKTIHAVTASALTFSLLALIFLFATAVASHGPVYFNLPWSTQEGLKGVLAPVGPRSVNGVHAIHSAGRLFLETVPHTYSYVRRQSSPSSSQRTISAGSVPRDRQLPSRLTSSSTL